MEIDEYLIPQSVGEWAIHSALTEAGRRAMVYAHNNKIKQMYRMTGTQASRQYFMRASSPGFLETQGAKMGNFLMWLSQNKQLAIK